MKVTATNSKLIIDDYTSEDVDNLKKLLSYKDKSKEYQLRRMSKNPFTRNSPAYKKVKSEINGCLLVEGNDRLMVPSGFFSHLKKYVVDDQRKDTGKTITLPWINKPHDARDYQEEAIELMLNNYRGLINFATGLGKTLTAVHAIRRFKKRTLIICPSTAIADNFYKQLCKAFGEAKVGYFGDGKKKIKDITVGIAQSVNNHIELFKKHELGLVITDEVHHLAADTFFNISKELSDVGRMYGLTATDFRSDGKDIMMTAGVGDVLIKRDLIWGIENGWLAHPYIIMRKVNTFGRNYKDDKKKNYKAHVLNANEVTDQIIKDISKVLATGKSVLCLVDEIEHGEKISKAVGLPFATSKNKESDTLVDQLNEGEISGLIGTASKIGEGCDTIKVDVLVLANFVASKGPLWQNLGRGMRLYPGKSSVLVLDYSPQGSDMLKRHAEQRLDIYRDITSDVKVI